MVERLYILLDDSWDYYGLISTPDYNSTINDEVRKDMSCSGAYDTDFISTLKNIRNPYASAVFTTQIEFLSFRYAKRLFVLYNDKVYEITLGHCYGTNRLIKASHNLKNLLLAGEFSWFDGTVRD